jgi:hypothetical protein
MGGTDGGGTAHSSEVRRWVLLSSPSTSATHRVISEEWTVSPPLVAPVVLLLTSGQFLLY